MIITKKHLPRRTFLRGALGTMVALPFLRCHDSRAVGAVQSAAIPIWRNLCAERHLPAAVASGQDRQRLRIQADHEAARTVSRLPGHHQQDEGAGWKSGERRRPHGRQRGMAERHGSADQAGELHRDPVEEDHRSVHRRQGRRRHAAATRCRSAPKTWARPPAPATAIPASSSIPSPGAMTPSPLPMGINPRVTFERMFGETGYGEEAARRI